MSNKVYQMSFSKIYGLLLDKAVRKGRTKEEVDQVITWLMGYTPEQIDELVQSDSTYQEFFTGAPEMNPHRSLITGSVCGVKLNSIEDPLMRDIRYLDKLIDELAKGKAMEKILRKPK